MIREIISSAQVSPSMYVERSADLQLKKIIEDMARPGYVLVARQMGKTNLLLHAKDKLQTEGTIFVYIDFSTMGGYTESECINCFIDTAIDVNSKIFEEAEGRIEELRARPNYKAIRMYNRELRVLLEYVDKIVFIMDEIDALTRQDYSDRVFSLIRGHYYAVSNYPELQRATYILSGVIEPKDIIRDPNISPFNIGEKIYLSDFTYNEFLGLIHGSDYLSKIDEKLKERIYYWTQGQPRMSWDLCNAVQDKRIRSIKDLDTIVNEMYLVSFDLPPIDAIRNQVEADDELRDALIQLAINKGNELSDKVKNKLYLAGIIDYKNTVPQFKNPVMSKSLSYDWLLSLHGQNLDYLREAEKSIFLEPDFKRAINLLNKYLESKNVDENVSEANYLLAESYYRSYKYEEALDFLSKINNEDAGLILFGKAQLLRANLYTMQSRYADAEKTLRELLSICNSTDEELIFKTKINIAYIESLDNSVEKNKDAEAILTELCDNYPQELVKHRLFSLASYYLSSIISERKAFVDSVKRIDAAIMAAQPKEKPELLYTKLMMVPDNIKPKVAQELYDSLDEVARPPLDDFDNPLNFSMAHAASILCHLILYYPQFDVVKYLRKFLYESKENALCAVVCMLLQQEGDNSDAIKLLHHTKQLILSSSEWQFDAEQKVLIALQLVKYQQEIDYAEDLLKSMANEKINAVPKSLHSLFNAVIGYSKDSNSKILKCADSYKRIIGQVLPKDDLNYILASYIECVTLYNLGKEQESGLMAYELQSKLKVIRGEYSRFATDAVPESSLVTMYENVSQICTKLRNRISSVLPMTNISQPNRNTKVKVKYKNGKEIIGKYKKIKDDIDKGLCIIVETYND